MEQTDRQMFVRSPFPPIGDYAFLSDCQASALIAPSGNVEWMCLPRMDSPSVFGAMLDRDAGGFRLGPADVMVPAARRYLPGTMILETSWGTPTGWIIVRDVLLIGPWHHEDERSQTPPPGADRLRRRPRAAADGALRQRRGAARPCTARPVFDYGRQQASWRYLGDGLPRGRGRRRRQPAGDPPDDGPAAGFRGAPGDGPDAAQGGRPALRRDVVERARGAARASTRRTSGWSGRLTTGSTGSPAARSRTTPGGRTSSAAPSRSRASPSRRPARCSRRRRPPCRRRPAESATGTTGSPGSGTPPWRSGRWTPSGSTGRPTTSSASSPTSPSARTTCRSCTGSTARRTSARSSSAPARVR